MIMRNSLLILFSFLLIMPSVNAQSDPGMAQVIDQVLSRAESQSLLLAKTMEEIPDALPRTVDKEGKLVTSNSAWWCSGFFPGTLWYLYENSGNKELEKYAWMFTNRINKEQYNKGTHDLGFMLYCSYGNALRITDVDSNVVERSMKSVALTRKNSLFVGSERGGKTFAVLASLVNTAKLNSVDPEAWLADVLERIISGKVTASQMDTLFPWTWKANRESIADQERRAA